MEDLKKKVRDLLQASDRLDINMMRKYLNVQHLDMKEELRFQRRLYKWAKEFGFVVEGNYLVKFEEKGREEKQLIEREREKKILEKFKEMISVSSKINLEMMRSALQMNKDEFNSKIFGWAKEYDFTIDNDVLIINQETVSEFIDELNKKFEVWGKMEVEKYEKI
ncbi:MAG: hypothetical protein ACFFC3_09995 [Candidatus Odinarchaeota archaeon]